MIGTTLAHYRITAALGAGGMGEVFRATDTRLGREVALKVLPAEFVDDPQRLDRFEREARAVAALNHPHIVTIYSVEDADGVRFLTMELVDGKTLEGMIPEQGLELETFFAIATPLAEAISAAHDKNVIHRDLKPSNVMVDGEGRVKVMDFGLAKLQGTNDPSDSSELATEALTGVGTIVGTVPYMSPEQIEGKIVDHRTDVFSLGVLLYEMATGGRPFHGESSPALMSSILKDVPAPLIEIRSDLPRHLGRVVGRCLEKDRRNRYQTARDVFNELKTLQRESNSMGSRETRPPAAPSRAVSHPHPPWRSAVSSSGVSADEGFWVAVLPFKYTGGDADLTALAEGLSEDIVTGLSRFSYLRVIARSSTLQYATEAVDVRMVGEKLGARYVMEGSLRRAGKKLRLAVQLVDTDSGAHLWAEAYDRDFDAEDLFALQDELVPRIVSTVADTHGVLPRSMSEALRSRSAEELSPYEAVLRSFSYFERVTAEALDAARTALELAVQKAPDSADAWAMLALLGAQEYGQGFKLLADPLENAANAARRAVEVGPSNHLAHFSRAQVLFFRKEFEAFRNAAARAAELNPMDGNSIAFLGELLIYSGDSDRGLELAGRAKRLNPTHPGWYWYADFFHAYSERDYPTALAIAQKVNLPDHWGQHAAIAVACGQLGDREAAGKALRRLLEIRPDFADIARQEFVKWWDPELVEQMLDGLRKAGLEIPPAPGSEGSSVGDPSRGPESGATRADEGFWVAVLPFKYTGGNADLNALAEGLSEEIVTGLSRFSYLRVIARSSTERYLGGAVDVRSVGTELAARYVMEGSIRQAGSTLRISVQLVDTSSGAHIWAETYERPFGTDAIFELQDDLVPRIVSTVADWYGILPHSMSEAVRSKPVDQLTPYEALLRGFGYFERVTPEEHAVARPILERAVEEAPGHAAAWAMLSMLYGEEHRFGFNMEPDPLGRSLQAARRAIETAPSSHASHLALAQAHYFRKDFDAFRNAAERAVALNPMDGATVEYLGHLLAFAGDWERGCELGERARQLNPHHPAWYWALPLLDAYRKGDYLDARALVPKALMPGQYYSHALFAALYGQLGEREAAVEAIRELLALRPDFAQIARDQFEKWYLPQLVEQLIDGLGKAGLEIPPASDSDVSLAGADESPGPASGASRADEGFWVAVLPFKYRGSDPDVETLADGLADEIVSGLSRFSFLRVIASTSTAKYAGDAAEAGPVGRKLGARYVIEGHIRQAGPTLRISAQLVDTGSGAHLWAETYERPFRPEAVFELQDDLVPRIVSTVGDAHGILPHTMSELLRSKSPDELTPYEAVLRSFGYGYRRTPEEHAAVRDALERAVEQAPRYADALAMLALVYADEHSHGYNLRPDSIGRALQAARRAAEAAPSNAMALNALAWAMFFSKEVQAFRTAAEQSIRINPLNGPTLAGLGALTSYLGDWERGGALVERALELNPRHPGWYWFPLFYKAYREEDYRGAVNIALKINLPEFFVTHEALAAAYGQLGERDAAAKSLREMLRLKPDYDQTGRERLEKWFDSEFVEHLTDGLRKAGLDSPSASVPGQSSTAVEASRSPGSAASRADEGFWVAVLPFKSSGADVDLAALAEGLSEDIVTGLSRFSYLRVIARGSATTGARYLMEGSLRRAGTKLRAAVQLVDTESGAHLWAEAYDRDFDRDDLFVLQDDLVPRIVSTCADHFGVLARAISEAVRGKPIPEMTPYEALMRGFGYHFRLSPDEHAEARDALERAVEQDPANPDCQAMLAWVYAHEVAHGFNPRPGSLDRALSAARKAVDLAPSNHLAQQVLAVAFFFRGETAACRSACERALALNPLDGSNEAIFLTAFIGDWEKGCTLIKRAMDLNPHHPPWYGSVLALDEYRRENYRGAVEAAIGANAFDLFWTHWLLAAAHGQLGEMKAARKALEELLSLKPDFAQTGRQILERWFQPELVEHFIDGLCKAGLELRPGEIVDAAAGSSAVESSGGAPSQPSVSSTSSRPRADQGNVTPQEEPAETKSIVVLPFANLSSDPDAEYFSDGLTDEIITDLSRVRALRVISRSSAMRLKGDERGLAEIGRDLDCRYVLEGSVRRAANNLRITARLVDAPDDAQLWSDKFEGTLDDVFDIQERVSRSIVDALEIRLTPREAEQLAERPIPDVRAQECYLRARREIWSFLTGGVDKAVSHLEAGLALIGDNALLYQGLGEAYFQAINIGAAGGREEEYITKAERCAEKIFALEPDSPRGSSVQAHLQLARGDIHGSRRSWRRVLQAYPKDVQALQLSAHILGWLGGKPDAAAPLVARLLDIDPLDPMSRLMSVTVPLFAGRFSEALEPGRRMLELDPVTPVWRSNYVMALSYAKQLDEAEALTEGVVAQPDSDIGTWWMGLCRAAWREDREEVLRLTDGPYQQAAAWDAEIPWALASAHAAVGATDEALLWLDRAIDQGMINYPFLSEHDHYLDSIRGDERFGRSMERARREWERFDV